jgi:hypothetical protein
MFNDFGNKLSRSTEIVDLDLDGHLDVIIGNGFSSAGANPVYYQPNEIYFGNGDGTFED